MEVRFYKQDVNAVVTVLKLSGTFSDAKNGGVTVVPEKRGRTVEIDSEHSVSYPQVVYRWS